MSKRAFVSKSVNGMEIFHHLGVRNKAPYVMLHGIGSDASSFFTLADKLADKRSMIIWNAPGYGNSQHLKQDAPLAIDYAVRLHQLLRAMKAKPVILVGHSLGTLMATAFASQFPDDIQALVLLASAEGYGCDPSQALPEKLQDRLNQLQSLGSAKFAEKSAPNLIFNPESHPDLVARTMNAMSRIEPVGYTQAVKMLCSGTLKKTASTVQCPSLTMVGVQDTITPVDQSENVHQALSRAAPEQRHEFVLIAKAGHAVHQQQPAKVARLMTGFLKNLEADALESIV